jgi:hypothetical protein
MTIVFAAYSWFAITALGIGLIVATESIWNDPAR